MNPASPRALLALTLLASPLATASAATVDHYSLDPMHTAILFHVDHFGFSHPSGKFMHVAGTLTLDPAHPDRSAVEATIPIDTLDTGITALDVHLKSADFFDAARYPTARYHSTSVTLEGNDSATVQGLLTLHGATRPVELHVHLNRIGVNMFKRPTAGFTATGTIRRSDFGITAYLPGLGDTVDLEINSEANRTP